ncbi:sensor histidine kinase [Tautonia sociabilis]|uniref:histidine kinase n=1 Tax=Tautonia sociabilis TaxID=2080755 RepID=A0A432MS06_9BACT|nr:HAMP domain-containing sensor histidine kinase [Tautonia sociabilis]RUL89648.1 PAS domain S-box protein [Tautonia sociabilis]
MEERHDRGTPRPIGGIDEADVDRLRRAISGSTEGLWEWDVPTGMVWFSPQAIALLSDQDADSPPLDWGAVRRRLHPDDADDFNAALDQAADQGELDVSFRLRLADGDRWFRARGAIPEAAGKAPPVTLAGSIQDVDELHRALDRNAYLAAIVDAADEAIIGLDRDAAIVSWNGGASRLFGRPAAEVLGQPAALLAPWVRLDLLPDLFPRALRGETVTGQFVEHRRDDATRLDLALTLGPVRNARGTIVGASIIARDVTSRRAMERRLIAAGRDLRRRSDELEQFVYTVSHDLKSPLVTCTGYVGLLEEDLKAGDSDAAVDSCRRVRNAVSRMSQLIDDLLSLSRIGRPDSPPRRLDLPRLLSDLADTFGPRFQERSARLELGPNLPPAVFAAERDLARALENLLENALKYACDTPGTLVTLGALAEDGQTRIFVRDTGPGIDPDYHQKIFGLFQRLDASKPGTGVGLASVAKVASVLGGRAWVESEPGLGATFWIALPDPSDPEDSPH